MKVYFCFQNIIEYIIENFTLKTLRRRLPQILKGLAKKGSPAGIRLTMKLMDRIPAGRLIEELVENHVIKGRNSKVREMFTPL